MIERLARGVELTVQSLRVLREEKSLLVLPALSGLSCLAILISFLAPLWNNPAARAFMKNPQAAPSPSLYALMFLFYFMNYFVIIFFNSALVTCAIMRFKGGNPTISDGLQIAMNRLPQIVGWALVSATVGVLLKMIESKSKNFGRFIAGILGAAWTVTTYFVVPILVVERAGPLHAMSRSFGMMRKTWGESLTATFGIEMVVSVAMIVAWLPALVGFMIGGALATTIGLIITVSLVILVSLIAAAVQTILSAAIYLYAADGTVPVQFDEITLSGAFARRDTI